MELVYSQTLLSRNIFFLQEIQRLVAPPVSEEALKKQKRGPKEYRRHGKAINHDYCDSCLEGGDLLCCDRCPVSFHLQCQ